MRQHGILRNKTYLLTHLVKVVNLLIASAHHRSKCYLAYLCVLSKTVTLPPLSLLRARPVSSDLHRRPRRSEVNWPTRSSATLFLLLVQVVDQGSVLLRDQYLEMFGGRLKWEVSEAEEMMCSDVTSGPLATSNVSPREAWSRRSLVICDIPIKTVTPI